MQGKYRRRQEGGKGGKAPQFTLLATPLFRTLSPTQFTPPTRCDRGCVTSAVWIGLYCERIQFTNFMHSASQKVNICASRRRCRRECYSYFFIVHTSLHSRTVADCRRLNSRNSTPCLVGRCEFGIRTRDYTLYTTHSRSLIAEYVVCFLDHRHYRSISGIF